MFFFDSDYRIFQITDEDLNHELWGLHTDANLMGALQSMICTVRHWQCLCYVLLYSKRKELQGKILKPGFKSFDYFSTFTKIGMINLAWILQTFGPPFTEKKIQQLQLFQTFPNRHKRTWCSRSNIMGLPPFDNVRLYSHLSAVKTLRKSPISRTFCHNAAHISPYCALLPYHKSGDTLWMWLHIYSSITGSRFWPLAAFFRLFSVYSSICAISKEKKKSHDIAMKEAQVQPRELEHSSWLPQNCLTRLTASLT